MVRLLAGDLVADDGALADHLAHQEEAHDRDAVGYHRRSLAERHRLPRAVAERRDKAAQAFLRLAKVRQRGHVLVLEDLARERARHPRIVHDGVGEFGQAAGGVGDRGRRRPAFLEQSQRHGNL